MGTRIDLHTHSSASDGTDSPAELVAAARAAELDVVALTDHDTTAGWGPARAAAEAGAGARPLTLVTGLELSCVHRDPDPAQRGISLHLLGYRFDPDHPPLRAEQARLRDSRRERGAAIVANLVADGYPITWTQVLALAEGAPVGRPHIARALVVAGVVPDIPTAFATLLSPQAKYHVRKADTDVFAGIALIRAAGGVTVFAHPLARRRGPVVSDEVIAAMARAGLAGLEVDHPDHDEADRRHARGLARELGLIAIGASDYHGASKATAIGAELTSPQAFETLFAGSRTPAGSGTAAGPGAPAAASPSGSRVAADSPKHSDAAR